MIEKGRGEKLVKKCWEEEKERVKIEKNLSKWEREKEEFWKERKIERESRERGRDISRERQSYKGKKDEKRLEKHNRWHGMIKNEEIPRYLKEEWTEHRWRKVIKFRRGNEVEIEKK